MTTFAVYRAYAADDALLYIGCTKNLEQRMKAHRYGSPWFLSLDRVEVEEFTDRAAAEAAEATAIATEHPRWNVHGRSPQHPDGPIGQNADAPHLRDEYAAYIAAGVARWRAERVAVADRRRGIVRSRRAA